MAIPRQVPGAIHCLRAASQMNNLETIPSITGFGRPLTSVWRIGLGLGAVAWLALVVAATLAYPGNRVEFLVFVFLYTVMAALALPRPRLYGYTFLAGFLFFGFCAKSIAFLSLGIALVEPTGRFNGSGHAWDSALLPAIAGSAAVVTIRLVHLVTRRVKPGPASPFSLPPPAWFLRMRSPVLVASWGSILLLNGLNFLLAFYQIGVIPRLVLPAHLSVIIEWLFVAGLAMWASTLVGWQAQSSQLASALLIPFGEALASLSTLSRSAFLFRALSYLLVVANFPAFFRSQLTRRWHMLLLMLVLVGFVVSIAAVTLLRTVVYPLDSSQTPAIAARPTSTPVAISASTPTPVASPAAVTPVRNTTSRLNLAVREIGVLVVGRWIGIEGTMAVSSYPGLGIDTFRRALTESPSLGETAFYQRLAGSSYHTSGRYEFLTTPGAIAILEYSGSLAVVAMGMALITALLIAFELAASHLLGNALTVSVVALTLANAVVQMQFPYLFLVFLAEQAVALVALGVLSRGISRHPGRVPETAFSTTE